MPDKAFKQSPEPSFAADLIHSCMQLHYSSNLTTLQQASIVFPDMKTQTALMLLAR